MLSGRRLDIINPSPLDIEIEDIAHGLAFQARWNGQTRGKYVFSVANHSILVWNILLLENPKIKKKWQLISLLLLNTDNLGKSDVPEITFLILCLILFLLYVLVFPILSWFTCFSSYLLTNELNSFSFVWLWLSKRTNFSSNMTY